MALLGGALADRMDRRRMLLLDQVALVLVAAALCAAALAGEPHVVVLYVLGGMLAGFGALQNVARTAIVPNLVSREDMPAALALNFGLFQLTMVLGPGLGGLLIAAGGVESAYAVDAVSCFAMVAALRGLGPQLPAGAGAAAGVGKGAGVGVGEGAGVGAGVGEGAGAGAGAGTGAGADAAVAPARIGRSIGEGLRFVRRSPALLGSFAIDLSAMTFGMPRALFPILAVSVYGAGAAGTGLLFASVSAGAAVAALTTGWLGAARRLGRITVIAVSVWGLAIAAAGLAGSLWPAAALLAIAGAADSVSAVCRSVINQTVTPDAMRGRMSSVFSLVVTSGPRLGDVEAGAVASLTSVRTSVVSGGLACVAGALVVSAAFPALIAYDKQHALAATSDVP